jgi:hypothetical protein
MEPGMLRWPNLGGTTSGKFCCQKHRRVEFLEKVPLANKSKATFV